MSQFVQGIIQSRAAQASRTDPTVEDLLREKLQPVIREWVDTYLPPIVEPPVRIELERLSAGILFED